MPVYRVAKRISELGIGFSVWYCFDFLFDYVLYPYVIWKFGIWAGGVIMSLLSLISCMATLWIYDRLKRDWLGLEYIKSLRFYDGSSWWQKSLSWLLMRGDAVAFFALSIKYDPFITTAYLRRGAFNGMNGRDWTIFIASWLVANIAWILVCAGGISVFSSGIKYFR